ncbi:hypothetical protein D3C78_1528320 [compost metagenome]
MIKPGVNLQHAVAQGSRDAEHGTYYRKNIDCVANRPVYAIADDGIKRGTQRQGQAMTVAEERQDQRHDGINRPGMQAPVEEG